jgi:hypothetical protein
VNGYVNSRVNFDRQPEVINGGSDLLEQIFGEHVNYTLVVLALMGYLWFFNTWN